MKKFITLLAILLHSFSGFSQSGADSYLGELPLRNGRIYYTGIDSVSNANKDELFNRAKSFLASAFPNFKDVVKLDDRDLGKIVVRGLFETDPKGGVVQTYMEFWATTTISVKDGKFKYEISDFIKPSGSSRVPDFSLEQLMFNKRTAQKRSPAINGVMNRYIASLANHMKAAENNW